jgi:peroxiredoxin
VSYLISPDGKIAATWPKVDVSTHWADVLEKIAA